jgi:polyvinyl alcohol dehydrogenase (cytochrome)
VGTFDNWVSAGQVLPLAAPSSGTTLGILGAASNGQASGTAKVTYTDSSTQTFTLTFSDWTLHHNTSKLTSADTIVAAMPYRNTRTGHHIETVYLFYTSVTLNSSKTVASLTLPSAVTGGQLHVFSFGVLTPSANSAWTTYLGNAARTDFNGAESTITPANAAHIAQKWTVTDKRGITGQPIVVNGQIYVGSWDGTFHDTPITGGPDVWDDALGLTTDNSCDKASLGITSTAAYGIVNGTPTVYVGGGGDDATGGNNDYLYALNATTGAILWKTITGSSPSAFPWSSPLLYNGFVYYGVSSLNDCPLVRGVVIKMNAATGAIVGSFYTTPSTCIGAGLIGSPSIDTNTGMMYLATGNSNKPCNGISGDYGQSIVEINPNTMTFVASWEIPKSQQGVDSDFLSTPTIFTATIKGVRTTMVGAINKNGIYYALNARNIAAGPVWEDTIGVGGDCPPCGTAPSSSSSWDGRVLYIGGDQTTINGTSCGGSIQAVNAATGAYLWRDCLSASVLGSVLVTPGVVFANYGGSFGIYNAGNGATLFSFTDSSSTFSHFWCAPTVVNGYLYNDNEDGILYAFH